MAKKYIDADKLKELIDEKWKELADKNVKVGGGKWDAEISTYLSVLRLIDSLHQEQPGCVEKTARISPGLISNFGTSTYVLDVDFTQDEMAKIVPFGFSSGKIKIKIVCE